MFEVFAEAELQKKARKDFLRQVRISAGVDFASNDYLGFARSEILLKKFKQNIQSIQQLGSTGSRLLSGHHSLHEQTEVRIAKIFQAEKALLFSSGYLLNVGLIQCLGDHDSVFVVDELCHHSLIAGARASKGSTFFFRHNDLAHLRQRLQRHSGKRCFIVVESLYSMDGDAAPLKEIVGLAEEFEAEVVVDEAHGTGVLGDQGLGLVTELGLEKRILARVVTFSKALGCEGAAVLGSERLMKYVMNFCATFIYTTGLSIPLLVMINSALDEFLRAEPEMIQLKKNIKLFSQLSGLISKAPIIPWITADPETSRKLSGRLLENGFNVFAIFPPTVPKGKERLRIVLHSFNQEEEITRLCQVLKS